MDSKIIIKTLKKYHDWFSCSVISIAALSVAVKYFFQVDFDYILLALIEAIPQLDIYGNQPLSPTDYVLLS